MRNRQASSISGVPGLGGAELGIPDLRRLDLLLAIVVAMVIISGVYARAVAIAEYGLWNDELHSIRLSDPARSVPELIEERVADEGPPLYHMFLYGIRNLGVGSEWGMRLVQNLLFVGGVLLLWTPLNSWSGVQSRLTQSAFLIGSYGLIYYSSELRAYSLVIALAIPQALLLLKIVFALEKNVGIPHRWMIPFVLVSVALSLMHYVAAVALGASFGLLAGVVLATGRIRDLLVVVAYGFAGCLPVVGWFVAMYDSSAVALVQLLGDPVFLARQIDRFLRLLGGSIVAALCLAMLIAAAAWTTARAMALEGREAPIELKAALWLGMFAGATWVFAYIFTFAIVPIVSMRNLLVTAPAIYLALGFVIGFWWNADDKVARAGIATTIVYFVVSAISNVFGFESQLLNSTQKRDWVASAELINGREECVGQPIVVLANRVGFYRHYIDSDQHIELIAIGTSTTSARAGDGRIEERVELSAGEVAQARERARSSSCDVKMWYVPTGFVSEEDALDLGSRILGAGSFRLERIGNAMLFRG